MSKEALMADEGLQQDIREMMFDGPDRRRRAMKYITEKGLGFSLDEFFDFLENPGDEVELHELELDFVVGGQGQLSGC